MIQVLGLLGAWCRVIWVIWVLDLSDLGLLGAWCYVSWVRVLDLSDPGVGSPRCRVCWVLGNPGGALSPFPPHPPRPAVTGSGRLIPD